MSSTPPTAACVLAMILVRVATLVVCVNMMIDHRYCMSLSNHHRRLFSNALPVIAEAARRLACKLLLELCTPTAGVQCRTK